MNRARHLAIITAPLPGHLNPLQVLGAELVAAGHRVTIVHLAATERFVTDEAVGFAALPERGDGPLDAYLATLARPTGAVGFARMIRSTAAMTETLLDGAPQVLERIGADAVIADAVEPAGPLIAARLRLPHVVAVTGLPLLHDEAVPPPFLGWRYRVDGWGRFRNRTGYRIAERLMRPIARVVDSRARAWGVERGGERARVHVAQCPRGLDYPRPGLPPGFLYGSPWRRTEEDDPGLFGDGRPLVFCSLGTLQGSRQALFATMARACAIVGARAVIGHAGGLTAAEAAALPGDPLVRAFWPQVAVLRRCSAAILHGGFNTVLDALAAGVPIVTLPIAFEQPATAARVARIGAGVTLSPRGLDAGRLARALDRVMGEPGFGQAARELGAAMAAAGGARQAAAAISGALDAS